ncbi:MAG TPA: HEPN domain-containing protein [Thermoanaerobaculia bacterium]|jgi:HEPN domain-containing protein|nr:HEPN domain-containing protein [Thermoanaerobaculia bacterium]
MSHDPALVAETGAWLRKAASDIRAASVDLATTPPLTEDVVFHAQQAAEKILKGFLVWHGRTFRKTHSLEEIGEQCLDIDPSLRLLVDRAVPLTEYAWKFRYPGDLEEPERTEAEEALAVAREIFEGVLERLPAETWPPRG